VAVSFEQGTNVVTQKGENYKIMVFEKWWEHRRYGYWGEYSNQRGRKL